MVTINKKGYEPVECSEPLPCPFCGKAPELCQLAHHEKWRRNGRSRKSELVRICILASTAILKADTFWFKCPECGCVSGKHHSSAQDAAEAWNRRHEKQEDSQ